jgi:hypothetical protein
VIPGKTIVHRLKFRTLGAWSRNEDSCLCKVGKRKSELQDVVDSTELTRVLVSPASNVNTVFLDVRLCSLLDRHRRFEGTWFAHLQGRRWRENTYLKFFLLRYLRDTICGHNFVLMNVSVAVVRWGWNICTRL